MRIRTRHGDKYSARYNGGDDKNIVGGWPDLIVNDTAVELKRGSDGMAPNQILCHEWLRAHTGKYPEVHYTDTRGAVHVFVNYKEFLAYPGVQRPAVVRPRKSLAGAPRKDLVGFVVGTLTVVGYAGTNGQRGFWTLACKLCGAQLQRDTDSLTSGAVPRHSC